MTSADSSEARSSPRDAKFRQAAFVYLHVAILYEAAAYVMWRHGLLPATRLGPPLLWLFLGAVVATVVVYGLLKWRTPWFARVVWAVHGLRIPTLIKGAFFAAGAGVVPSFYLTALVVVMINLWMLARAGWDL